MLFFRDDPLVQGVRRRYRAVISPLAQLFALISGVFRVSILFVNHGGEFTPKTGASIASTESGAPFF